MIHFLFKLKIIENQDKPYLIKIKYLIDKKLNN